MTAGCIIIMVITLFFVGEKNVPYVLGDEFGYWTSAAYFSDMTGVVLLLSMVTSPLAMVCCLRRCFY